VYVLLSLLSGYCLRWIHVSLFDVLSPLLIQVYRTYNRETTVPVFVIFSEKLNVYLLKLTLET